MRLRLVRGDPRLRILVVVFATVVIVSTPGGELRPFAGYFALCALLIAVQRVPGSYLGWRCAAASPFILFASGLLAVQQGLDPEAFRAALPKALSVACKAYAAVLLLTFLTDSTPMPALLDGLRRLGSPNSLNLILGMMHRYSSVLSEEYGRMERARDSRTVRPIGRLRFAVFGNQLGALIMRSLDRAERIHAAMLSRGFTGVWPVLERRGFGWQDFALLAATTSLFLMVRILA